MRTVLINDTYKEVDIYALFVSEEEHNTIIKTQRIVTDVGAFPLKAIKARSRQAMPVAWPRYCMPDLEAITDGKKYNRKFVYNHQGTHAIYPKSAVRGSYGNMHIPHSLYSTVEIQWEQFRLAYKEPIVLILTLPKELHNKLL